MKMQEALDIINQPGGYMVGFDRPDGDFLCSDHFPDKLAGEPLIEPEEEAWRLAQEFAAKTKGRFVNIYVIDQDFRPVAGWQERVIANR